MKVVPGMRPGTYLVLTARVGASIVLRFTCRLALLTYPLPHTFFDRFFYLFLFTVGWKGDVDSAGPRHTRPNPEQICTRQPLVACQHPAICETLQWLLPVASLSVTSLQDLTAACPVLVGQIFANATLGQGHTSLCYSAQHKLSFLTEENGTCASAQQRRWLVYKAEFEAGGC